MRTTIDGAGRLVVPKDIRDRMGLSAGVEVEITERDGLVEIGPAPTVMKLRRRKGTVVAIPAKALPPLTDEIVRDTIERTRR